MKIYAFIVLALFAFQLSFSQNSAEFILSNTDETYFIEGKTDIKSSWWLDSSLDLDVYETNKISVPTWITFHTDIDTLGFSIRPGEHHDFTVILNGKDTCRTRVLAPAINTKYAKQFPATHDTLPFTVTSGNNIKVKAVLNGTDTLDLFFDSGATSIVLTHDAIRQKTSLLSKMGKDYQTRDYHPLPFKNSLAMGNNTWNGLTIFPVSVTGQETDGHFGWNLFDGRLVEINYDQMYFVIHSSLENIPEAYAKCPMEYINTLFCINGTLTAGGKEFKNRYLFDTGYQRSVLLDRDLMQEQEFPQDLPVLKVDSLRNGEGKVFVTKVVNVEELNLGGALAQDIPTQLLSAPNPARFKTHILGNELLKRYNLILDFYGNAVYLKRNDVAFERVVDTGK